MSRENRTGIFLKEKSKLIIIVIVLLVVIGIVISIFNKVNVSVAAKYEEKIENLEEENKNLEEENKRLSDPIVQYEVASREVDLSVIEAEMRYVAELVTIEYLYTDAGKFEDPAVLFGKEVPFSFTTKSFIAKWDGSIKAGVNVDEITLKENPLNNKEIIVHIPEAEIISHEIDNESIETLNEKNGLFNPIQVDDIRKFDSISKTAMEQRAIENGLLNKAYENAKEIISKLINSSLPEETEYTITFE